MYQLYKHLDKSATEICTPETASTVEFSHKTRTSTHRLPQTLEQLIAGFVVQEKKPCKSQLNRSPHNSIPIVPVDLDVNGDETSLSDSDSESPVHVELPPQPYIHQHTVSNVDAQISWSGPRSGELVSFYEVQLQEARLVNQSKNIKWFCSQTEEHLENLAPDTIYIIHVRGLNVAGVGPWSMPYKFATLPPVPGMPLNPSPVIITVLRHRKPQKKTIFLPA